MARRLGASRFRKRGGLITLALSSPEPELPSLSPDPEITETDIWLRRLGAAHDGLKVVHLTDIHHSLFTPLEDVQRAVHLANLLQADIVALTGDYVTLSAAYIYPVARALGKLRARLGVFAVLGNHDFQVDADGVARALKGQGIRVLRNSHVALHAGPTPHHTVRSSASHAMIRSSTPHPTAQASATLWIAGVDDLWWKADDFEAATRHIPARDPKLLLCHNPLGIHKAVSHSIDFVLSGHTHGGQVRLPVVGSVHGRSKLGERFVDGWNRLDGTQIYVNRGIGKSVVPLRVNCPPEIACFRLRRA